jgi:ribonuclease HII
MELFPDSPETDMLAFEAVARRQGYWYVAGIDEAGRGPLAGPVVAAAVMFPPGMTLPGVMDSKQVRPDRREELLLRIHETALSVGIGQADSAAIDRHNILQATLMAMAEAVARLSPQPDFLLIDGITPLPVSVPQRTIKKGDSLSLSVAAASIVAKVTRDRVMEEYDHLYPGYGFAAHKGYGSAAHMVAIARLGPSPIHRTTFRGVREHVRERHDQQG